MSLVDDLDGLRPQNILVTPPVMAAEEQIGTTGKHDTDVGLSAAAIAAVGCAQGWSGQCLGHVPGTSQSCRSHYAYRPVHC